MFILTQPIFIGNTNVGICFNVLHYLFYTTTGTILLHMMHRPCITEEWFGFAICVLCFHMNIPRWLNRAHLRLTRCTRDIRHSGLREVKTGRWTVHGFSRLVISRGSFFSGRESAKPKPTASIWLSNLSDPFTPNPLPNSSETTSTIIWSSFAFHTTFLRPFCRYFPFLGRSCFYSIVVLFPYLKPLSYGSTIASTSRLPFPRCIELSSIDVSAVIINCHLLTRNNTIYNEHNTLISEHDSNRKRERQYQRICDIDRQVTTGLYRSLEAKSKTITNQDYPFSRPNQKEMREIDHQFVKSPEMNIPLGDDNSKPEAPIEIKSLSVIAFLFDLTTAHCRIPRYVPPAVLSRQFSVSDTFKI
ncbi:hypothetical protein EUTSA_v10013927mg [Eutrema salsugineum]|uniref:Uncharacterized protein n=1 Tax=Eutrema salsugineum TaxID=72664 RepID=V4LDH3_EUTSA|nr:hypothetical protein EUTSA_v10013927mg [Eutrema salsugineum]